MKKMLVLSIVLAMLLAMSSVVSAPSESGVLPIEDGGSISIPDSNISIQGLPVTWVNATDLKAGYHHLWKFANFPSGTLFGIPYYLPKQAGSSSMKVEIEDYGVHDDVYALIPFDPLNDEFIEMTGTRGSYASASFSTNSPFLVVYVYLKKHTSETTTWDFKVTTTRYS